MEWLDAINQAHWINERYDGRLTVADGIFITFLDSQNGDNVNVFLADNPVETRMVIFNMKPDNRETIEITAKDALQFTKGERIARRTVYHFVTKEHATALRAGLTIHHSAFSSTPHHFELTPEPGFEEVFYFLLPGGGKGLLEGEGMWPDGTAVDAAWPVRHRQFAQVPMGWHRVTGLPSEDGLVPRLAYVWCYLAIKESWEK